MSQSGASSTAGEITASEVLETENAAIGNAGGSDRPGRHVLGRIVILALANGLLWASLIPPWQTPDEPKHFEYVRLIAERGEVIAFATEVEAADPDLQTEILGSMDDHDFWWYGRAPGYSADDPPERFADAWKLGTHTAYYRASPAYYWLAARVQPADRLIGLYMARLLSVTLGALIVLIGGIMAREAFPDERFIRFGTPAFLALYPMIAFTHAGVNSDVLVNTLVAFALLVAVRLVVRGASPARLMVLGLALVAAALVKRIGLAIAPALAAGVALRVALGVRRPGRAVAILGAIAASLAFVFVAWLPAGAPMPVPQAWRFAALRYLFNEPDQAERIAGVLASPSAWQHMAAHGVRILDGFWGRFGWETIALPRPLAWSLNGMAVVALLGLARRAFRHEGTREQRASLAVAAIAVLSVTAAAIMFFAAYLATPYAQPPQGRYLITVAPAAGMLLTAGLGSWIGEGRSAPALKTWIVALFILDLAVLFGLVVPYFYS